MTTRTRIIIGVMSGTSVDAIDAAIVTVHGTAPNLTLGLGHVSYARTPWPESLRPRLLAAMAPATLSVEDFCRLNTQVSMMFARAATHAMRQEGLRPADVDAIASHGQTICHLPPPAPGEHTARRVQNGDGEEKRLPLRLPSWKHTHGTLQLGDPSIIAAMTGVRVVGNFRPADMAAGGQGAPLVPWADMVLFRHDTRCRCVQNIGGIANVTFLPPRGDPSPIIAFDTGPGNMLMDAIVSIMTDGKHRYDPLGRMASEGVVDMDALKRLQRMPYFRRQPPKSTGRELFGVQLATEMLARFGFRRPADALATATRLTAWSIADAYRRFLPRQPDEMLVCGGGAWNRELMATLCEELDPAISVGAVDELGVRNAAREATAFALLAAATLDGVPSNVPSVTGADRALCLGVVADGVPGFFNGPSRQRTVAEAASARHAG